MAHKRMFSKDITESDAFADMPLTTQALYFHLGMNADDDGFINNAKRIQRGIGASADDLNLLIAKKFLIKFDSGVVVIKHWRVNNTIRNDRKNDTKYSDEMNLLTVKENGAYTLSNGLIPVLPIIEDGAEKQADETLRQKAYRESDLPYSFGYKIRNAFFGEPCPVCGAPMGPATDGMVATDSHFPSIQHNIPISKGGKHELGNISVICHECNVSLRDTETGKLNAEQVIQVWDDICQANARQMSGKCPSNDGIDIEEDRIGEKRSTLSGKPDASEKVDEIVGYLNAKTGKSFRTTTRETVRLVNARLKEGYTVDDFKAVIDKKVAQWANDPKFSAYLQPSTLFAPSHFENYLNAVTVVRGRGSGKYGKYD